jgi:hypothetical protein
VLRDVIWGWIGAGSGFSAIAVVERAEIVSRERDPVTYAFRTETRFHLRDAERIALGSPYPQLVERVRVLVGSSGFRGGGTTIWCSRWRSRGGGRAWIGDGAARC